ncbi:MAG: hypothetical protein GY854_00160 [Deltaproteobacteria bacterium]|nr:hypothetical protein [Deltaproteobacteria bacterium]
MLETNAAIAAQESQDFADPGRHGHSMGRRRSRRVSVFDRATGLLRALTYRPTGRRAEELLKSAHFSSDSLDLRLALFSSVRYGTTPHLKGRHPTG